ncbi:MULTISPECIES: hypothetical protein [Shewanella]|uniref:Uncharacterized protein n=3 Tax=Bacteria TaxID=2 RepID=A0A380BEE8_9GAMM|nr:MULTISPECIES: hypothetical protein [Shewanella]MBC8795700.1 hypothetical protein [Shewanella algae]MBO2553383.1 hypothetical protein [Shewanella algae]MBO2557636.1 hypothetical protein [Shewanella algae]MBO2561895.1 hypothetical protein [Shewanella algae]MBO2574572.1 hypothetical protein [Shewanella algae]
MRQSSRQKLQKQHQRATHVRRMCYFRAAQQDQHHAHYPLDAYRPLLDMMHKRTNKDET